MVFVLGIKLGAGLVVGKHIGDLIVAIGDELAWVVVGEIAANNETVRNVVDNSTIMANKPNKS